MRDLSFESMETKTDSVKMDRVVGAGFERSEDIESKSERSDEAVLNTLCGWTIIICLW